MERTQLIDIIYTLRKMKWSWADDKVAFEDIPVFGVCRSACHDSLLYLFVLVLFLDAVVLSQVHVAVNIFYQHIVHVYRGLVYNYHIFLCHIHLIVQRLRDMIVHFVIKAQKLGHL